MVGSVYLGFALLTGFHDRLPLWMIVIAGAYLVALHGSLQHEVVHGHPTRRPWLNALLIWPNLSLWLPFGRYRRDHLRHHRSALTDPVDDPESYYLPLADWRRLPAAARALLWGHNTVAGRLLLGPWLMVGRFLYREARRWRNFGRRDLADWSWHLSGCAVVLVWVIAVCGMRWWEYLLYIVYPGLSLTLLRSYCEHRASPATAPGTALAADVDDLAQRSVLIESGPLLALLYLNNNLHALHHAEPWLPWYRLPARYRQRRAQLLTDNGGYRYRGYGEVIARYLLWPKEPPWYPPRYPPC